jgi:hypothetical protein
MMVSARCRYGASESCRESTTRSGSARSREGPTEVTGHLVISGRLDRDDLTVEARRVPTLRQDDAARSGRYETRLDGRHIANETSMAAAASFDSGDAVVTRTDGTEAIAM